MSILSSNNAGFQLTVKYLQSRGYVFGSNRELAYFGYLFSSHYLRVMKNSNKEITDSTPLDLYIVLQDSIMSKDMMVKSIQDLDLVESMWKAKAQKTKLKIKKKLLSKARSR